MTVQEICINRITTLPEPLARRVLGYIDALVYNDPATIDDDTDYLKSIPGMWESIEEGSRTPSSECIALEEIWPDVLH
ncbi:MAG: hypothetical protein LBM98_07195 [Oscillospiraceae bacterium]|jgi:hypothetical protein|nr:hypothetical protein [Oscillospiraceae bacterium]